MIELSRRGFIRGAGLLLDATFWVLVGLAVFGMCWLAWEVIYVAAVLLGGP
jgi:hypothetical protein